MAALAQVPDRWSFRHSTAIAGTFHLALILAVLPLALSHPLPPPTDDVVRVEIVAPPSAPAKQPPSPIKPASAPTAKPQAPRPPKPATLPGRAPVAARRVPETPPAPASTGDGLVVAHALYAAEILADPRSAGALKDLRTVAVDEQSLQVCNLEAMEQIERLQPGLKPDFVMAYARHDIRQHDLDIRADGAVFHSGDGWYGLRYRCQANADRRGVSDFAFAVEEPVPEDQWAELNLPSTISSEE